MAAPAVPTISVVVTTYGRGDRLEAVLLETLTNVAPAEVVVVDDGSPDGTLAVLERLARDEPRLRVVRQENAGQPSAMLAGARSATGDVVLLIDDDVVPDPGTAAGHAAWHARENGLVVVGYMPVSAGPSSAATWSRDIYARAYEQHCDAWERHPESVLTTLWAGQVSIGRTEFLALTECVLAGPSGYHNDLHIGLCAAEHGLHGRFDRTLRARHLFERSPQSFAANARSSGAGYAKLATLRPETATESASTILLPRAVARLVARPRGDAAVQSALRIMIAAAGRLRVLPLQRHLGRELWRVLRHHGFREGSSRAPEVGRTAVDARS